MRVLLTDGHYKHALGAARQLADAGHEVLVTSPRRLAMAAVSRAAARRMHGPASTDADAFLAHLDATVRRHRPGMILPVGAAACGLLSRHRDRWPGVAVVLPPSDVMDRALDKRSMLALATELGIAVPRTEEPADDADLERAGAIVGYPLVIKAPLEGRTGVAYVDEAAGLMSAVAAYRERYGLPAGTMPLLQQRIVGPGLGVFATYQAGRLRRVMAHRRLREFPVNGGESTCCELVDDPALRDAGRRVLDALGWHGVAMVEFKRNHADGRDYLMEVNPKLWGSLDLALAAGADFPLDLVRIASGETLPDLGTPDGPMRLCWPLGNDLLHLLTRPRGAPGVLRDWFGGARTNLRLSDPLPHLVELATTLGRVARGGLR
jgi:predicted ATP-grasp superfamily ATP-dependent carboligase